MSTAIATPANTAEKPTKPKAVKAKAPAKTAKKVAETSVLTPDTLAQTKPKQEFSFIPYQQGKNEEYMSDEQLAHFKTILLGWKQQLVEEAESTKSYIQDESSAMPDINDRATQEEEFALALRTRDRERKLIRKIDKSLSEMEGGDYGFCQTCGVEIGIRRLEARPTASQCIDCKTLSEMKERQAWGH